MLPAGRWLCVTGGSWARLCWDRSATTKQLGLFPLGWHLGSSPPCPVPTFPFSLHSVHATGAAWGPSGEAGCGCCPIFGMFSSSFPSYSWCLSCVMEPFVCCGLPAAPCPRWGCQVLVGAPGWFLPTSRELQVFSFPKERRSQSSQRAKSSWGRETQTHSGTGQGRDRSVPTSRGG